MGATALMTGKVPQVWLLVDWTKVGDGINGSDRTMSGIQLFQW